MKAQFVGCTLVVYAESEEERERLKYYGSGATEHNALWECWGYEDEGEHGSLSVQSLCPVELQPNEIVNFIRQLIDGESRATTLDEDREIVEYLEEKLSNETN